MATTKTLYEKVIAAFPELASNYEPFITMQIVLKNDSDGTGDYIAKWDYAEALPEELKSYLR